MSSVELERLKLNSIIIMKMKNIGILLVMDGYGMIIAGRKGKMGA